jgi:hypothetical protein
MTAVTPSAGTLSLRPTSVPLMLGSIGGATCVPVRLGSPNSHLATPDAEPGDAPQSDSAKTAGQDTARGDAPPLDGRRPGVCARAGFRLSRASSHTPVTDRPPLRPDSRTSVPPPGPARECRSWRYRFRARRTRVQTQLIKARIPRRQRGTGLRSSSERVCRSALRCA